MIPDEWVMSDWELPKNQEEAQAMFQYRPTTLEQAILFVKEGVAESKLLEWAYFPKQQAISLAHFSLGMWIRNQLVYGYGSPYTKELEKSRLQPDDISSIILDALWNNLNGIQHSPEYYIKNKTTFEPPELIWD